MLIIPRETEDDEESEESDEEDESEINREKQDPERGREKDEGGDGGRRAHSLDRHPRSPEDPFRTAQNLGGGMTIGRGTLSRGKQPRGTMLWSSDSQQDSPDGSVGMKRTESLESVVHLPQDGPVEEVPKDEIELLEEAGLIPPETTVAPLKTPELGVSEEKDVKDEAGDGMEDVGLEDEVEEPEAGGGKDVEEKGEDADKEVIPNKQMKADEAEEESSETAEKEEAVSGAGEREGEEISAAKADQPHGDSGAQEE